MNKKELKRDLKLYKSDLNSMADESIYYRERAERVEAMLYQLVKAVHPDEFLYLHRPEDHSKIFDWYEKLRHLADKFGAVEPKPYRAESKE